VLEAFLWGAFAASSLVIGGAVALWRPVHERTLGLVLAFGAGVLISAVAYELALEAFTEASGWRGAPALGFFAGVATFYVGDSVIDRLGGEGRKSMDPAAKAGGVALAIVLGIVLDGVPESAVIGMTLLDGGVSVAVLVAVFLSNLPEAFAATANLREGGRSGRWIVGLWVAIALVSGLASLAGYALLDGAPPGVSAFVLAFAGGAILTMLADTMMPEAFVHGGKLAGVVTSIGFAIAFVISTLE
jgi:zinc transporter, ZIP family